jgi:hypothetical protein
LGCRASDTCLAWGFQAAGHPVPATLPVCSPELGLDMDFRLLSDVNAEALGILGPQRAARVCVASCALARN